MGVAPPLRPRALIEFVPTIGRCTCASAVSCIAFPWPQQSGGILPEWWAPTTTQRTVWQSAERRQDDEIHDEHGFHVDSSLPQRFDGRHGCGCVVGQQGFFFSQGELTGHTAGRCEVETKQCCLRKPCGHNLSHRQRPETLAVDLDQLRRAEGRCADVSLCLCFFVGWFSW